MKKAVVAENFESLVKKGRHIFIEIGLINISNSARRDLSMTYGGGGRSPFTFAPGAGEFTGFH